VFASETGWYHRADCSSACGYVPQRWEGRMAEGDVLEEKAQDKPKPSIKVTDRRHFTSDGERRTEVEDEPEAPTPAPAAAERQPANAPPEGGESGFERRPVDEPEGVDFTMLINAMAQPALLYLGEIPHPATGQPTLDLEGARIQIDMLDLLRVKSRGNLTPQEENLLESVLYQLRMRYVARSGTTG
jgi:hypothetical protein